MLFRSNDTATTEIYTRLYTLSLHDALQISKSFLANPLTMLQEGWELLTRHGFLFDIGMTIWRVVGGFVLAAIIAVPLGVLMGAYKPIEAFL